jgi:glycosyl transferase family 2
MATPDSVSRPEVSVIVPARNEEASLGSCLQSLVQQESVGTEIIVVDDASTDRTRPIAQSFPLVRVIDPGPLPEGWTGKNHALTAGARQARGEWLLFTDADTVHIPGSLARALIEAKRRGASLLSYSPAQDVRGVWEKAVMPVIFAELASIYRPSEVSEPTSPVAAANGQYLLVSRDVYQAVGGHAAVAQTLLEDVALARAVKASGRKIYFRYGGDAVRTRMYRSFSQLVEGWTKNLVLLFPATAKLAALRLAEFVLIAGSAGLAISTGLQGRPKITAAAAAVAALSYAAHLKRIRRAHFSWEANLLSVFGLPIFSYLLLRSRLSYKRGSVSWKGRSYGTAYSSDLLPQSAEERPGKIRRDAGATTA